MSGAIKSLFERSVLCRRGGISIFAALTLTAVLTCAALAVDMANYYLERRTAQGVADLAAMNAAAYPDVAQSAALNSIQANHLPGVRDLIVTKGLYLPDKSVSPGQRFQAGVQPYNAVQVQFTRDAPVYFARVFRSAPLPLTVSATAGMSNEATLSVGTRLVALKGGAVNSVLSALLGTSISLSVMDYQALASANIRIDNALNAISAQANLTAVTYDQLLNTNLSPATVVRGLNRYFATTGGTSVSLALNSLAGQLSGAPATVQLSKILNLGNYGALTVGQPQSGLSAKVSAFDLIKSTAMLANGGKQVSINAQLNIPGVTSAVLSLSIGEPMQHSAWASVGQVGSMVSTSQLKLRLVVQVGGTGLLSGLTVRLPLYAEAAYADANLAAVSCAHSTQTESATIAVTPGIARVAIADVSDASMSQPGMWQQLASAQILAAPLVQVSGQAQIDVGNDTPTDLQFTADDVAAGTIKQTDTSSFIQSIVSSLLGKLTLRAQISGLSIVTPAALTNSIATLLSGVAAPLDDAMYELLTSLGIHLGQADVQVDGIHCGSAALVN